MYCIGLYRIERLFTPGCLIRVPPKQGFYFTWRCVFGRGRLAQSDLWEGLCLCTKAAPLLFPSPPNPVPLLRWGTCVQGWMVCSSTPDL